MLSSTAIGRGLYDPTTYQTLLPDPMAASFKRQDARMMRIKGNAPPRPENYMLTSGDLGDVRRAERPSQPHQEDPGIRRRDPMVAVKRERRKAAHVAHLRRHDKVKLHDSTGWKLKPWEADPAAARDAERRFISKEGESGEAGLSFATEKIFAKPQGTGRASLASTCTNTTIGGGVVHPLRTPKGVTKPWDRDDGEMRAWRARARTCLLPCCILCAAVITAAIAAWLSLRLLLTTVQPRSVPRCIT